MGIGIIRRRIKWRNTECAVRVSADLSCLFTWNHRSREMGSLGARSPQTEPVWELYFDGEAEERFSSLGELKCHIIRFVYDIRDEELIPSEVLYDAGLLYVTNEWVDGWSKLGSLEVESRSPMPGKPEVRSIQFPDLGGPKFEMLPLRRIEDSHRTGVIHLVSGGCKKEPPYKPHRLNKGDDFDFDYIEECDIWVADQTGAGLDHYDVFDDDECYYVLGTGEDDAQIQACATVEGEKDAAEEEGSQIQDAQPAAGSQASDVY